MTELKRTDSYDKDFIGLIKGLDAELAVIDGEEHDFYSQFNGTDDIKHVVVVYENGIPKGCGAIKEYSKNIMEIKRMYVVPGSRNKGIASLVLSELERWSLELFCVKCVLETGKRQVDAVNLYKKNKYTVIPNYGQYAGIENSICFEKELVGL
jgi:GNAT superfamily N-acetyltransferase